MWVGWVWEAGEGVLVGLSVSDICAYGYMMCREWAARTYCALRGILACVCDVIAGELGWAGV